MKNRSGIVLGVCLCLAASLFLTSCQNTISPNNTNTPSGGKTGIVAGKVVTTNNAVLPGVRVAIGNLTASTDAKGEFYFSNVPVSQKTLVNFSLDSYSRTQKIAEVNSNKTSYVEAALMPVNKKTLNAATGGTIQFSGAQVVFPANAIVDGKGKAFTGAAQLSVVYFDPTTVQFVRCFPGDFAGVQTGGGATPIESFGYVSVEMYNGTEKLQLASGQQATVTFPIPSAKLSAAPATIPLWYYDETNGNWIEEGSATKTGGAYIGTVKHFSNWNCDMPTQTSYLEGKVVDQNGAPLSFVAVQSQGVDYTGSSRATTNDSGYFKISVKSGATVSVWARYYVITSTPQNYPTPATGQITNIGTITLPIDTLNLCTIIGRVIDNGNLPVTNYYIQLLDQNGKSLDYIYSNADGKFKFIGAVNSTYKLIFGYAKDSTQAAKTITIITPSSGATMDLGDIKLDIGGSTLIGRVVDAGSKPLAGVNMTCTDPISGVNGQGREVRTDSLGRFSLWVRPNITFNATLYYNQQVKTISLTSGNLGETKDLGDITFP